MIVVGTAFVVMECYASVTLAGPEKIAACKLVETVASTARARIAVNVSARTDIVVKVAKCESVTNLAACMALAMRLGRVNVILDGKIKHVARQYAHSIAVTTEFAPKNIYVIAMKVTKPLSVNTRCVCQI